MPRVLLCCARIGAFAALVWLSAGTDAFGAVNFTNVTTAAGINYSLPPGPPGMANYIVAQAGGAAARDFDNDGWPDLFVSRQWDAPILYRNNRDGTFSDVTSSAITTALATTGSNGVAWGDVDNDGDADLYVTSLNFQNQLFINDGAGHFADEGGLRGAALGDLPVSGTSASFGDYDSDGYLDMYVTEWRVLGNPLPPHTRLLHNRGVSQPGFFDDVTAAAGVAMGPLSGQSEYGSLGFTPRFADLDRDGHTDLLVASDSKSTRLFWNNGDGTFTNGTPAVVDNLGFSDMGLAIGDVDGDGLLDWFTTDIYAPTDATTGNRLFRNFGDRVFLESSNFSGVRDAGWGWGTDMLDYDNDRDLDIVATNGFYFSPAQETDQMRLWANNGVGGILTTFSDVATQVGMTDTGQGRGLLTFDYDRDGDLDVFVVNNYAAPVLYRNDGGNESDWLQIEALGTVSNSDGVGAFITLTPDLAFPDQTLVREISGSSNYLSQSEPIAHFGLGSNADLVDLIRVEWPASGIVQELRNVVPNQRLTVTERLVGDFNGDGSVDSADYTVWRNSLGETVDHGTLADANGDGVVDTADYESWKTHFGSSISTNGSGSHSGATATVPEPAAIVLACSAVLLFCPIRKSFRSVAR